jgi:hypothetical protein
VPRVRFAYLGLGLSFLPIPRYTLQSLFEVTDTESAPSLVSKGGSWAGRLLLSWVPRHPPGSVRRVGFGSHTRVLGCLSYPPLHALTSFELTNTEGCTILVFQRVGLGFSQRIEDHTMIVFSQRSNSTNCYTLRMYVQKEFEHFSHNPGGRRKNHFRIPFIICTYATADSKGLHLFQTLHLQKNPGSGYAPHSPLVTSFFPATLSS